jgi:hypothetical protein
LTRRDCRDDKHDANRNDNHGDHWKAKASVIRVNYHPAESRPAPSADGTADAIARIEASAHSKRYAINPYSLLLRQHKASAGCTSEW